MFSKLKWYYSELSNGAKVSYLVLLVSILFLPLYLVFALIMVTLGLLSKGVSKIIECIKTSK